MTILTPLPTPPATSDPATFAARADAFLAALQTMANEINAAGGTNVGNATTFEGLAGDYYAKVMKGLTHYYLPSMSDHCRGAYRAGYDTWSRNQQWGGPFMFKNLVDGATGVAYSGEAATGYIEDGSTSLAVGNDDAHTYESIGFKVAETQTVAAVWIKLYKMANPANNFSPFIYSDSAGSPNAAIANGTATAQSGKLHTSSTNGDWYRFSFATPPSLTGGTQYHIVMKSSAAFDGTNYWKVCANGVMKYPFGNNHTGDGTPTWSNNATWQHMFLVELSANAQTLQASGLFDGKAVFGGTGADGTLTMSRGLCNSVPLHELMDVTNHTCYDVWSDLTKDRTFVDYGWGEDHDRVVLRCNVTTGYPQIDVYSSTGVKTTVTSAIDCSSGNHSIGWQISPTVVKLFVDGTTYTSGAITLAFDNLFGKLGTMWIGGGFALAPTWTGDAMTDTAQLPSHANNGSWTWTSAGAGDNVEAGYMSMQGGKLFQNKNGYASDDTGYYSKDLTLSNANGWNILLKAKSTSNTNTVGKSSSNITIIDGTELYQALLHEYYLEQYGVGNAVTRYGQADLKNVENIFHFVAKGTSAYTFVNRRLVMDASSLFLTANAGHVVNFGDGDATAGENADAVYSYLKYYNTAWNPPQFTAGALHESATWQGDMTALWLLLYNGGTRISAKALLGIPQNYLDKSGKIPAIVQRGITSEPTTTSTGCAVLPEMEGFVIGASISVSGEGKFSNSNAGAGAYSVLTVDGVIDTSSNTGTVFAAANYPSPLNNQSRFSGYLGLHKVENRWNTDYNTASANLTVRNLIVEPKL